MRLQYERVCLTPDLDQNKAPHGLSSSCSIRSEPVAAGITDPCFRAPVSLRLLVDDSETKMVKKQQARVHSNRGSFNSLCVSRIKLLQQYTACLNPAPQSKRYRGKHVRSSRYLFFDEFYGEQRRTQTLGMGENTSCLLQWNLFAYPFTTRDSHTNNAEIGTNGVHIPTNVASSNGFTPPRFFALPATPACVVF